MADFSCASTRSTAGTIVNRLLTLARAATNRRRSAKPRFRSAIAGSAITASPSQLGAMTSNGRPSAIAPPPMHPQPQPWVPPDVHLEYVGAALREVADRIGCIGLRRIDRVLVDESIPAPRQREREHRNHGGAGSQRKRRERRSRGGAPLEEVDAHRIRGVQVLVDQQ